MERITRFFVSRNRDESINLRGTLIRSGASIIALAIIFSLVREVVLAVIS